MNKMASWSDLDLEEFGEYLSPFEIFVEGIGADRISDMLANIIKEDLIKRFGKYINDLDISIYNKFYIYK